MLIRDNSSDEVNMNPMMFMILKSERELEIQKAEKVSNLSRKNKSSVKSKPGQKNVSKFLDQVDDQIDLIRNIFIRPSRRSYAPFTHQLCPEGYECSGRRQSHQQK